MIQPQFLCGFFLSRLTLIEANRLMEYFMQLTSIEKQKKNCSIITEIWPAILKFN